MKIRFKKAFIFIFLVLLLLPYLAFPFSYQPQTPVFIKTQILLASGNANPSEARIWRIVIEKKGQSGALISFFYEKSESSFCWIKLSEASQILDLELPGAAGNILQKNNFLFVPGYPAPCDIFPLQSSNWTAADGPVSYEVQRNIGGQRFVDKIRFQSRLVSVQEASTKGWIRKPAVNLTGVLHVFKAINCRSNQLICLQVWQSGADWWVYEETPYRRSWQIYQLQK
mgnify:FL=1